MSETRREHKTQTLDLFKNHAIYPCSKFVLIANTSKQSVKIKTYDQSDAFRAISYENYVIHPGQTRKVKARGSDYIYVYFSWQSLMETPHLGRKYIWNGTRLVEG